MMNWSIIYDSINSGIVYLAVGCATNILPNSGIIEDKDNQQYPPFITKFDCFKTVILIDPLLEDFLAIEKYLIMHEQEYDISNSGDIKIIQSYNLIVFAIKDTFEILEYNHSVDGDVSDPKIVSDTSRLIELVNVCLSKNVKLIFQNFTGKDTTILYIKLFNMFERTMLLKNILFDVTQKNGGCFIDMDESQVELDDDGYFVQEKYMKLNELTNHKHFNDVFKYRVEILAYYLSHDYMQCLLEPSYKQEFENCLKLLSFIYNIDYNEDNQTPSYLMTIYEQVFRQTITDMVISKRLDEKTVDDLMFALNNRELFTKSIKTLSIV
jgi:hypothetical protein